MINAGIHRELDLLSGWLWAVQEAGHGLDAAIWINQVVGVAVECPNGNRAELTSRGSEGRARISSDGDHPWEEVYRKPYEILRGHCEEIGRPFEEIKLTAGLTVWLPDDVSTFKPTFEHSFYPGQPFTVLGPTPADAIREIERLVDVGVSHFQPIFEDLTTMRRFIDEVVPMVRLEGRD